MRCAESKERGSAVYLSTQAAERRSLTKQIAKRTSNRSGDNSGEVTPVPISNTVVKLLSADDTWREAAWESRTLPVFFIRSRGQGVKTSPFHGGNTSSNLVGATKKSRSSERDFFIHFVSKVISSTISFVFRGFSFLQVYDKIPI